jgi:hypothetical protein
MNKPNAFLHASIQILAAATAFWGVAQPALAADGSPLPLSIAKECSKFTGHAGDFCTITQSSLAAIPVGAKVIYFGPVLGPPILASTVLIDAGGGNTAMGSCNVEQTTWTGTCAFWAGSGSLQGFEGLVKLTVDKTGLFHWDGAYSLAK